MDKSQSNLIFIDRVNFINLQDAKFNLEDLRKEITGDVKVISSSSDVNANSIKTTPARSELLSPLTIAIIDKTNELLNKSFFDGYFFRLYDTGIYHLISEKDIKYVSHYVKDYLTKENNNSLLEVTNVDGVSNTSVNKKYYELIPLLNGDVLVVLEEAFFNITTESKNSLTEFVLDCLRLQYKFGLDYRQLMKLYLKLHINENALNMVKLRFN